ncbi:MAG: hypothetical protein R3F20_03185 [Planctomycetota bacterium]
MTTMTTTGRWLALLVVLGAGLPLRAAMADAPAFQDESRLEIFDLRDLVRRNGGDETDEERLAVISAGLKQIVGSPGTYEVDRKTASLVVRAEAEALRRVRDFLTDLRAQIGRTYWLRLVALPAGSVKAEPISGAARSEVGEAPTISFVPAGVIPGDEKAIFVSEVTTFVRERSELGLTRRLRYVTGWKLEKEVTGHPDGIAVPTIEDFLCGTRATVKVVPSLRAAKTPVDRGVVTLEIELESRELRGAVERETPLGKAHTVEVSSRSIASTVTLVGGGAVLFRGRFALAEGGAREMDLLLVVDEIEDHDETEEDDGR